MRTSKKDPFLTAVDIKDKLKLDNISVHTVRRRLERYIWVITIYFSYQAELFARRPADKPWLSKKNKIARLAFAKQHLDLTVEDWKKLLWSDESKFNKVAIDGGSYVRRPTGKRFDQITQKLP